MITEKIFEIEPSWQPIETAPKDGSVIRVAIQTVQTETGEARWQYNDVFWGKMKCFQDSPEVWVSVSNPDNGLFDDSEFIRQISIHNHYGVDENLYHHTGMNVAFWTRPWEVKVIFPPVEEIIFFEKIYDNRKNR